MFAIANQFSFPRSAFPALSENDLRVVAPSVFAEQPMEGVSHRYAFPAQEINRLIVATPTRPLRNHEITDWQTWLQSITSPKPSTVEE